MKVFIKKFRKVSIYNISQQTALNLSKIFNRIDASPGQIFVTT